MHDESFLLQLHAACQALGINTGTDRKDDFIAPCPNCVDWPRKLTCENGKAHCEVCRWEFIGEPWEIAKAIQTKAARKGIPSVGVWKLPELLKYKADPSTEIWGGGVLCQSERTALIGAPGAGKSRLALQSAIDTILGREFLGWKTNAPGKKWLFLQTENSARRLHFDLVRMLATASKKDIETLTECLHIFSIESDPSGTMFFNQGHTDRDRIGALIQELDPAVVCIDPLRDVSHGDLNKDFDMTAACQSISELVRSGNARRVPLCIHHGRTGAMEASRVWGDDAASFGRNSKVLYGWLRSQINVAPAGVEHEDVIILGCGKNSNGERWKPFAARIENSTMRYHRLDDEEFDIEEWSEKMGAGGNARKNKRRAVTAEDVAEIVRKAGGEVKGGVNAPSGLVSQVCQTMKVGRPTAEFAIAQAMENGLILSSNQKDGRTFIKVYKLTP